MKRAWIAGGVLLGCGARTGEAFPLGTSWSTSDATGASDATRGASGQRNVDPAQGMLGNARPDPGGRNGRGPDRPRDMSPVREPRQMGAAGSSAGDNPDPALVPVDEPTTFDTCTSPLELPFDELAAATGTLGIVPSTNQSTCFENGADLFFRWTAPRTDAYVFFTTGTEFDSVLTVYSSDCVNQLGCNDDAPGSMDLHAEVRAELTEGESVVLVLSSYYDTSGGTYRVGVSPE